MSTHLQVSRILSKAELHLGSTPNVSNQSTICNQVLLSLGSNFNPDKHIDIANTCILELGKTTSSKPFKNPDYTATIEIPKPDYTNQCVILKLSVPMEFALLESKLKEIEQLCKRDKNLALPNTDFFDEKLKQVRLVSMDIDILAIQTLDSIDSWIAIQEKYPFKEHELAGLAELF